MGAGKGVLKKVRHRYEAPKCAFLFDLVTTRKDGGSLETNGTGVNDSLNLEGTSETGGEVDNAYCPATGIGRMRRVA